MKRFGAWLLVMSLILSSLTGCGGKPKSTDVDASTQSDSISTSPDESGSGITEETTVSGQETTGSNTTGGQGKSSTTKPNSSGTKAVSTVPSVNIGTDITGHFELPKFNNVKGTTVELYTWGSAANETAKDWIQSMKDVYGITLKYTTIDQSVYDTTLQARMMSKNPPDVILLPTNGLYTYPLNNYLENITGKIDLNNPMWKGVADLNRSRFLFGKHYLSMVGSYVNDYIWFNRAIMEENGISNTPDKLYDKGEWTVDNMLKLAKQFTYTEKSTKYYGLAAHFSTLGAMLTVSRGASMVAQQSNGQFISKLGSPEMADAMGKLYDLYNTDKVVMPNNKGDQAMNTNAFYYGQSAMLLYSSSLSSQSRFAQKMQKREISFVPFPKWDKSNSYRQRGVVSTFGVGKGTDNLNGALAFLNQRRYGSVDLDAAKIGNAALKKDYYYTDKEISYLDDAKKHSVMASWDGVPKNPQTLMTQDVSMGASWASVFQNREPFLQLGLKELNDLLQAAS